MPMSVDNRWPFWPKLALLIAQVVLSLICLGLFADLTSLTNELGYENYSGAWFAPFGVTTAVLAFIGSTFLLVTFLISLICSPLIALIVDAVLVVFLLITVIGTGNTGFLGISCLYLDGYGSTYTNSYCTTIKGAFAMVFITFLVFIGSLILSAIMFHRQRKGLSNTAADPNAAFSSGAVAGAPPTSLGHPMQQTTAAIPQSHTPDPSAHYTQTPVPQSYTPAPTSQYMQSPVPTPAPNYQEQQQYIQSSNQNFTQPAEIKYQQQQQMPV